MRARRPDLYAVALAVAAAAPALGQVAFPDHTIQNVTWTSGTHHTALAQPILSPGAPSQPVSISAAADAEFVSGAQVHLTDGFHAGAFTGGGRFRAYIDDGLGAPADLIAIAPDPATHIVDNVLHVEKWEKLELGLRLPQEYQDAIDSFFVHFYPNGVDTFAVPNNLDRAHDLNPYADDSLQLVMTLTSPSNAQHVKWGFFMKEGKWASPAPAAALAEDYADPLHPYHIRFRFAPPEEGVWQFTLSLKAPHTTTGANVPLPDLQFGGYSFVCDPPLSDNKGYLEVNTVNRRNLQFEDGTPFLGLGTNMADQRISTPGAASFNICQRDFDYMQLAMEQLHSVGGNFLRMFLMRNLFAPEWINLGVYDHFKGVDPCDTPTGMPDTYGNCQYQCWAFDQMLDHARANDIYLQVCVDPYPPIVAYENYIWGAHPYVINFIEPNSPAPPYDFKQFFYQDGDPSITDEGVFYYWKRKYKYMMSRWGYSVNLAIVEPFNEPEQMLTYRYSDHTQDANCTLCPENRVVWPADTLLPVRFNDWLTDIISFVKDPVDTTDLVSSPLGESRQLFLTGTNSWGSTGPNFLLPCKNPKLDLIDVHRGYYWGEGELAGAFDESQALRDTYFSIVNGDTIRKPFHQGESNYYSLVDHDNDNDPNDWYESHKIFSNYDVSFHNEIWAGTFFGNFATASTWLWERVFWWPNALPHGAPSIPPDFGNQLEPEHSGILGDTNLLFVDPLYIPVVNRTTYHHFKPLHDLLTNPNWSASDFFGANYTPHKIYDAANNLECYYLMNADSTLAIGWVHNLNAYWENNYYVTSAAENFLDCTAPTVQQLTLPGFQSGLDYHISWHPTRMDTTALPENGIDSTGSGSVMLDLSTSPLGDTIAYFLDTLHADHAFIVALYPVPKSATVQDEAPSAPTTAWDFSVYPNPASTEVNVLLPRDGIPKDIAIHDLSGKRLHAFNSRGMPLVRISTDGYARGVYCIRVSDGSAARMRTLVKH